MSAFRTNVKSSSRRANNNDQLWLFTIWGIDLIGQLPKGRDGAQYTVDYFTKWVKAEALASITPTKIKELVYKNIVC